MKLTLIGLNFLILALCAAQLVHASDILSPEGLWRTYDDKTGVARGLVRIYLQDGKIFGKIEHGLTPGDDEEVCLECKDERKNQPIVGLVIMRNMVASGTAYYGGDIMDPDDGSIYRCKLRVIDNGARLIVRGYIGMPLFGRSQIWVKEN